jgi:hypothetical protein
VSYDVPESYRSVLAGGRMTWYKIMKLVIAWQLVSQMDHALSESAMGVV